MMLTDIGHSQHLADNKIPNLAVITISNDRITAFVILFVFEFFFLMVAFDSKNFSAFRIALHSQKYSSFDSYLKMNLIMHTCIMYIEGYTSCVSNLFKKFLAKLFAIPKSVFTFCTLLLLRDSLLLFFHVRFFAGRCL